MLIIVDGLDYQWNELTALRPNINWQRVDDAGNFNEYKTADAFFSLKDDVILPGFSAIKKPVFVNSVVQTLADLNAPEHVLRINGWPTFLQRTAWEIAGQRNETVDSIFQSLNIKINMVKDEPGFITARIIAMIVNEAYFTVEDDVSGKDEIDIAMKLGTSYPFGPFEWAKLIGINNILALLKKLNTTDNRYVPSKLLIKEVTENNS